jgi:hypothetical protein
MARSRCSPTFWEDLLRYLYLPRLKSQSVVTAVINSDPSSRDFFGTAEGQTDGKYERFHFGDDRGAYSDILLLIEPTAGAAYAQKLKSELEGRGECIPGEVEAEFNRRGGYRPVGVQPDGRNPCDIGNRRRFPPGSRRGDSKGRHGKRD